jgi:HK97 family phage major capsid protein
LELIADENQAGFGWVAEQDSRTETTTPDISKRVIHAHEMYAEPRATQKLLDDAGFDVEGWLGRKVSNRFARAEATAFVTGSGVGQPRGFTTYPTGTSTGQIEQINSGAASALTADGIFDLVYSLKSPYLMNSRFMMARLTIRDVRKLKDGEGRYLWEPIFKVGEPASLVGYPLHQADDMPAVSAGNEAIVFGDMKTAYTIVDRKGIRVLRDPYTAKPYIKFYTTRRVGGDVVNFEAIKLQTISA